MQNHLAPDPGHPQSHIQTVAPAYGAPHGAAHQVTHGPSFAMPRVDLRPSETLVAEAGAMVARHQPVAMEVKLNAGRSAGFS